MNIAAAMAALRTDLAPSTRYALVVLACRADRYSGTVTRSLPALAADMGASERTALRAVNALRKRGYLQVTHNRGITSTYRLVTPASVSGVGTANVAGVPLTNRPVTPDRLAGSKRKTGERPEGARPLADTAAGASGVENPAAGNGSTWAPAPRCHASSCQCGGTGWVDNNEGEVIRCEG